MSSRDNDIDNDNDYDIDNGYDYDMNDMNSDYDIDIDNDNDNDYDIIIDNTVEYEFQCNVVCYIGPRKTEKDPRITILTIRHCLRVIIISHDDTFLF